MIALIPHLHIVFDIIESVHLPPSTHTLSESPGFTFGLEKAKDVVLLDYDMVSALVRFHHLSRSTYQVP